ncbi:MAG: ABC transporter substrate-binding protein, partial [Candidatus Saccharimonadales bacterium]
ASNNGETHTVQLRPGLTWQDGAPLNADDVAFTYHAIQNPMTQSPYYANWDDVNVSTAGSLTVVFKLPNPLASFKYSLTNGIVPKHLLGKITPDKLRSADFNTEDPVGAGPFAWQELSVEGNEPAVRQELIALSPFAGYHGGTAKLGGLVIHAYPTAKLAESGLLNQDIDGLAGLNTVPDNFRQKGVTIYSVPQTAETMVFFKETDPVLGDTKVRQALILAANHQQIIDKLPYAATAEGEPLLSSQLGYDSKYKQPDYDFAAAQKLLASDGWVAGKDGILQKGTTKLSFNLYASNNRPYSAVARALAEQWRKLGVEANVYLEDQNDFQNSLSSHNYDAVLTTIALGVDPDEYIYWDSSQADVRSASRLNLSEVKDTNIDVPLEAGRTRDNPELRAVKYQKFLAAWLSNEPALALFQPRFLYFTNVNNLYNFSDGSSINDAIGRYNNVVNWEIRQTAVTD